METYDVIVNQPVVIDNVSFLNIFTFLFGIFSLATIDAFVVAATKCGRKRRNAHTNESLTSTMDEYCFM